MSAAHVLPDSRLRDRNFGAVMMDWPLGDGSSVRIECIPTFCTCGKQGPYVPRDNTAWSFWLCAKCIEKWGVPAGSMVTSDHDFMEAVAYEIRERFGRDVTAVELGVLAERGELGSALEKLERESPYQVWKGA